MLVSSSTTKLGRFTQSCCFPLNLCLTIIYNVTKIYINPTHILLHLNNSTKFNASKCICQPYCQSPPYKYEIQYSMHDTDYKTSKVTIVKGSSVLRSMWTVENPLARWRHVNTVSACTWRPVRVERKLSFLLFAVFWLEILPQLNIKAVHNLKTKTGHLLFSFLR